MRKLAYKKCNNQILTPGVDVLEEKNEMQYVLCYRYDEETYIKSRSNAWAFN
jgi:hypothetical protein